MPRTAPALARIAVLQALALLAGCEDLREFAGVWAGAVSGDPAHQLGFTADAQLRATVGRATRDGIELTIQLPPRPGVTCERPETCVLPFEAIRRAGDDILGEARLPGEPLRTYFGYVQPPAEAPYLAVVSLFAEERVEVRLIRGPNQSYGVFYLKRAR
jgi:hypothetical protein